MDYNNEAKIIEKLESRGLKENLDFRVVYFNDKFEIKIIK